MKSSFCYTTLSLIISGCLFSTASYAQKPVEETATSTTIRAVNKVGGFVANISAYTSNITPYKVSFISGKAGALGASLGVVNTLTKIIVDASIEAQCQSTESNDQLENYCETPPSFVQDKFCIANTDNVNKSDIQVLITDIIVPRSNNGIQPQQNINVPHGSEACISIPKEVGNVSVVNGKNQMVVDRVLPIDFFSGNYGMVIKNGKPWLKKKAPRAFYNMTLAHKACYSIMLNSSFDLDGGVRKCMDKLANGDRAKRAELEKIFTITMDHADYQEVTRTLKKRDLNDFLRHAVYHQKHPSNPDIFVLSGTLMIDDNTYATIEPMDIFRENGELLLPDSIAVYKINTTPRNAPNLLGESSAPDPAVIVDTNSGPLDFATATPVDNNIPGRVESIDF
ncbi:hypothetical protein [Vibrio vulnificus]|uniref:hypothetical protein n=1 Tax=Vibrio vulnificus TaxID=672 RepID=UPI003F67FA6C